MNQVAIPLLLDQEDVAEAKKFFNTVFIDQRNAERAARGAVTKAKNELKKYDERVANGVHANHWRNEYLASIERNTEVHATREKHLKLVQYIIAQLESYGKV